MGEAGGAEGVAGVGLGLRAPDPPRARKADAMRANRGWILGGGGVRGVWMTVGRERRSKAMPAGR